MVTIHIQVRKKTFHLSILGPTGSNEPVCIQKQLEGGTKNE